jgi:hypothetical protein
MNMSVDAADVDAGCSDSDCGTVTGSPVGNAAAAASVVLGSWPACALASSSTVTVCFGDMYNKLYICNCVREGWSVGILFHAGRSREFSNVMYTYIYNIHSIDFVHV